MLLFTREKFALFFTNPIFLSCLFSWFSAQLIKTLINLALRRVHSLGQLFELLFWRTGGMPSSHTALVASLSTTIGFRSGGCSDVFILSLGFLMITIRDALGVRRSSGVQAKEINEIGNALMQKGIIKFKRIKEIQGHTPLEVLIGCMLGFFSGLAFSLL